jgi:hypothetical protein
MITESKSSCPDTTVTATGSAPFDFASSIRPVPSNAILSSPDYYIWCGSMVRAPDGRCHLFYSRWPRKAGFNAWVTHSEIAHATALSPLGPYTHLDVALPARGEQFWDGLCTHNPTLLEQGGKYYLYYMGNTGDRKSADTPDVWNWIHRNNQRIGVAVADQPAGPWKRSDTPLVDVSTDPSSSDSLMVSNPTVTQRPDGGFLMIYKAVGKKYALPFGGPVIHRVALSDRPDGPFIKQPDPVFTRDGSNFPAEDPFVWTQNGQYHAVLKDMHGAFTDAGRSLVLFNSPDGLHWQLSNPCLLSDRTVLFEDGSLKKFEFLERPQIHFENGSPAVLFCAAKDGNRTCNIHIPLDSSAEESIKI